MSKILEKLNLKYEDLTAEERETYHQMEEVFKEEITMDKIREFIEKELRRFQVEFANNENSVEKDFLLKAQTRNYTALLFFIESPKLAKQKLEEYLTKVGGLIKKPQ